MVGNMKKTVLFICAALLVTCSACSAKEPELTAVETAAKYMEEGDYSKAIETYSALISEDSGNAQYYAARAEAYAAYGTGEESVQAAIADYRSALELDDRLTDAYTGLARIYAEIYSGDSAGYVLLEGIEALEAAEGDHEEDIQMLKELMAGYSDYRIDGVEVVSSENLDLSKLRHRFIPANDDSGFTSTEYLNFTIDSPANVSRIICISMSYYENKKSVDEVVEGMVEYCQANQWDALKQIPTEYTYLIDLKDEDIGKTIDQVIVAVDSNAEYVGHAVVAVAMGG